MTVKEFYEEYNNIFQDSDVTDNLQTLGITFYSDADLVVIDHFIKTNFGPCELDVEESDTIADEVRFMAVALLIKNNYLYKGIYDALTTEFNPLDTVDITETLEGEDSGSTTKTGREVDSGTNSQTQTPNLTTTETPAETSELQNRTFDDNVLTAVEKTIQGGSNTVTQTGTNSITGTNGNTKEFQNVKDEHSNTKEETRTRTGHDSINFKDAIAAVYETKTINLIDRIVNDYATEIIIPVYNF